MTNELQPRPLGNPITDQELEHWKVQVRYRDGMTTTIALFSLGGILARLEKAEEQRDHFMREYAFADARREPRDFVTTERAAENAARLWGTEIAERLFGKNKLPKGVSGGR